MAQVDTNQDEEQETQWGNYIYCMFLSFGCLELNDVYILEGIQYLVGGDAHKWTIDDIVLQILK